MCSGRVAVKCLLKDHKGRTFLLPPHFLSGNPSVGHSHPREETQFRESLTKAEQDFLGPRGICRKKGMISTQAPESMCTGDARQPPPGQPRGEASRHLQTTRPPPMERPSRPAQLPALQGLWGPKSPWTPTTPGGSLFPLLGTTEAASTGDPSFSF